MRYRQDISCKRKFAYDMESAAQRWGSHRAEILYLCTHCGFVHFSGSNVPIVDRIHERALRVGWQREDRTAPIPVEPRKSKLKKPQTRREAETRGMSKAAGCRVNVWSAAKVSIGELLSSKIAEEFYKW